MDDKAVKAEPKNIGDEPLPQPKPPMSFVSWNIMIICGVFLYSSYTILVHLTEVDGKIPWSSGSMVSTTELLKLAVSFGMLITTDSSWRSYFPSSRRTSKSISPDLPGSLSSKVPLQLSTVLPFSVPAILYCLNNNLAVYIQLEADPATYQVLGNFKILTTAFLFRLIIKRPIKKLQWVALGLLLLSGISNSFGGMKPANSRIVRSEGSAAVLHVTVKGVLMIMTYCTISGLSGVYTEYVLKKQKDMNLHLQNSLLYLYGFILNVGIFMFQSYATEENISDPFHGYSVYTWLIIITQTFSGITMGAIMKYASNITRLFLISSAMVVTTVLSMIIFGLNVNVYFIVSIVLVIVALALYHKPSS